MLLPGTGALKPQGLTKPMASVGRSGKGVIVVARKLEIACLTQQVVVLAGGRNRNGGAAGKQARGPQKHLQVADGENNRVYSAIATRSRCFHGSAG